MEVNYVLMYGTPYLKYREFETFEDISKFLVNKSIVNYSIFKKLEDKEEVEMIYRDNDIRVLEKRIEKSIEYINKHKIEYVDKKFTESNIMVEFNEYANPQALLDILKGDSNE